MAATHRSAVAASPETVSPRTERRGAVLRALPGGGEVEADRVHADVDATVEQRERETRSRRREVLAANVARCALEAIAGVRDLDQLARWVTPPVYRALLTRVQHAARARHARRRSVTRPTVQVRAVQSQHDERRSDITLVVEFGPRVRAVCVVLELVESRWRATSVAVL